MAIPDGKPATDFSAMNREWVRAVAAEAAEGGGGIPAPENPSDGDVLTYNSTSTKWEAAAPPASGIPAPASPSDGDVLTYSSTDSAWVAAAPSGGGGGGAVECTVTEEELYDEYIIQMSAEALLALCMSGPVSIYIQVGQNRTAMPILRASYSTLNQGYTFTVLFGLDATSFVTFNSSDANDNPMYRESYN